jgi:hypothetical protein
LSDLSDEGIPFAAIQWRATIRAARRCASPDCKPVSNFFKSGVFIADVSLSITREKLFCGNEKKVARK